MQQIVLIIYINHILTLNENNQKNNTFIPHLTFTMMYYSLSLVVNKITKCESKQKAQFPFFMNCKPECLLSKYVSNIITRTQSTTQFYEMYNNHEPAYTYECL